MTIRAWSLLAALTGWPLVAVAPAPHATVIKSEPKAYDTTALVPSKLRVWFSVKVSLSTTRINLRAADKKMVRLSPPRVGPRPGDPVVVDILGALRPGVYRVIWTTVGEDGEESDGFYDFTLAPSQRGGGN